MKLALSQGKRVLIATSDIRATIELYSRHFPGALFTIVDEWSVEIHPRQQRGHGNAA
jgi:hypothetical protein